MITKELIEATEKPDNWAFNPEKVGISKEDWVRWGKVYDTFEGAELFHVSNYEFLARELGKYPNQFKIIPSSHWLVNHVDEIYIMVYTKKGRPTQVYRKWKEFEDKMKMDNPVLDWDDFSNKEQESIAWWIHEIIPGITDDQAYEMTNAGNIECDNDGIPSYSVVIDTAMDMGFIKSLEEVPDGYKF